MASSLPPLSQFEMNVLTTWFADWIPKGPLPVQDDVMKTNPVGVKAGRDADPTPRVIGTAM